MSDAAVREGKNRIMIYGPKDDGTYVVSCSALSRCVIKFHCGTQVSE